MHLRPFVLIDQICGFRKDRQMIEYTKDQRIAQKHQDVLQWARNAQNIIRYDNELKLIYLLRELHISFRKSFYQYQLCAAMLTIYR